VPDPSGGTNGPAAGGRASAGGAPPAPLLDEVEALVEVVAVLVDVVALVDVPVLVEVPVPDDVPVGSRTPLLVEAAPLPPLPPPPLTMAFPQAAVSRVRVAGRRARRGEGEVMPLSYRTGAVAPLNRSLRLRRRPRGAPTYSA
jgi:hypothetical protein